MKNSELKFIDIDLLFNKCAYCFQKRNYKICNFSGKDIFFCSRSNLINSTDFWETKCLYCFSVFVIKNSELEKYFIFHIDQL